LQTHERDDTLTQKAESNTKSVPFLKTPTNVDEPTMSDCVSPINVLATIVSMALDNNKMTDVGVTQVNSERTY
jgi:hypothetical protein